LLPSRNIRVGKANGSRRRATPGLHNSSASLARPTLSARRSIGSTITLVPTSIREERSPTSSLLRRMQPDQRASALISSEMDFHPGVTRK
jgi:hypothetical protein